MKYKRLPNTELNVSLICLGTMTYGEQNNEKEAHEQLDYSLSNGINFIDTAEMYAIPPREETQGKTESIIGSWLTKRKDREKIIIATKVAGPGMEYLRGGSRLDKKSIFEAVDASLTRLKSDYIDLYQVHWPERKSNYFGRLGYQYTEDMGIPIEETLEAMSELVKSGKVRYIGISNETPWGTKKYLELAEEKGFEKILEFQERTGAGGAPKPMMPIPQNSRWSSVGSAARRGVLDTEGKQMKAVLAAHGVKSTKVGDANARRTAADSIARRRRTSFACGRPIGRCSRARAGTGRAASCASRASRTRRRSSGRPEFGGDAPRRPSRRAEGVRQAATAPS